MPSEVPELKKEKKKNWNAHLKTINKNCMKHKKSESIWDATGSHTYYTVHKKKPIFKASSHTQPLLVIPEMAEGELRLHLKSLLSLACS